MNGDNADLIARIGERESYSDKAARAFFGESVKTLVCGSKRKCLEAALTGEAGGAFVPVHNVIIGDVKEGGKTVKEMADELGLRLISEYRLRVRLVLASLGTLEEIAMVYSIGPALDQCTDFFDKHKHLTRASTIDNKEITDTSTAAKHVKNIDVKYAAAICDADAAKLHDVPVIKTLVANKEPNFTTFFLYRKQL